MSDKAKREEELADLRWVMLDPRGRRFIRRLLKWTRYGGSLLAWNDLVDSNGQPVNLPPELAIWYIAGKRDTAGFIYDEVAVASPTDVQRMNREAYERVISEENTATNQVNTEEDHGE